MHEFKLKILDHIKNNPDIQHTNISLSEAVGEPLSKIKSHIDFLLHHQMIIKDKRLDGFVFYKIFHNSELYLNVYNFIKEHGYRTFDECYKQFNINSTTLLALVQGFLKSGEIIKYSNYRFGSILYFANSGLTSSQLKEIAKNNKEIKMLAETDNDYSTLLKMFHTQPLKIKYNPYL